MSYGSKGQFMLISAIIIGVILLTTSAIVSNITSDQFKVDQTSYKLNMITDEAEKLDLTQETDRQRFNHLLEQLDSYNADVTYNKSRGCANVTLSKVGAELELNCIGNGGSTNYPPPSNDPNDGDDSSNDGDGGNPQPQDSPRMAFTSYASDGPQWSAFDYLSEDYSMYKSYNDDLDAEAGPISGDIPVVSPPSYNVSDKDPQSPTIFVRNPNPSESWSMTWHDPRESNTFNLEPIEEANHDYLIFWEDAYNPFGSDDWNATDWKDEVIRVTELPDRYRIARYFSKGGYRHEFYIDIEQDTPIQKEPTFVKPEGNTEENTDTSPDRDQVYHIEN